MIAWEGILTDEYKLWCLETAGFNNPYLEEYVLTLNENEFWYFMWGLTN